MVPWPVDDAMACSAFSTRFRMICRISSRLTSTGSGPGSYFVVRTDVALMQVVLAHIHGGPDDLIEID